MRQPPIIRQPPPDLAFRCLSRLKDHLRLALCTSTTVSMALRGQAAERDEEFASLLDRCCTAALYDVIEDVDAVLQEVALRNPVAVVPADPSLSEPQI